MKGKSKPHRVQHCLEQTFREYFSIYNGVVRENLTESEEEIIASLFASRVSVTTGEESFRNDELRISQLKRQFQGFLQAGQNCEMVHFEFLDDHHVEYKTHITGPNGFESNEHSIATIGKNDNKIVSIEPFSKSGVARIQFEIKFRDYFALYDGSPKFFGVEEEAIFRNLFSEDFCTTIRRHKYDQEEWMETIKTCIEGGMKVDILKFCFARNSTVTFEYKLRVANTDDEVVVLHSLGTTTNGKFASFTPYNEKAYSLLLPKITTGAKKDGNGRKKKKKKTIHRKSNESVLRGLWTVPTGWERKGYFV